MGRKDWCTSKGCKYRAKGMYSLEKKSAKFCYLALFAVGMAVSLALGLIHVERAANANFINTDHSVLTLGLPYDSCGIPAYVTDGNLDLITMANPDADIIKSCGQNMQCYANGTQWTAVWNFNAYILMVQMANYLLLMLGAFWFWPRCIGTICNCCCGCCHLLGILSIFGSRFSP